MNASIVTFVALMLTLVLALTGCVGTGRQSPPLKPAPSVPPPGTGSGSPISIQLLAPRKPVVIEASQFETVRAAAEALRRKRQLIAEMRAAGQEAHPASLATPELRALHSVINQGRGLKQGIKLTLRVFNTGPDPVRIRYGPEIGHNDLWVDGPDAIYLPYEGMMTLEYRFSRSILLQPGASRDFPVRELRCGHREDHRWLIGAPGAYTVRLRLATCLDDPDIDRSKPPPGGVLPSGYFDARGPPVDVTSNEVTFTVQAGEQ